MDPAKSYERDCMMAVLSGVLKRLRASFEADGRLQRFEHLKAFLLDQDALCVS